MNVSHLAVIVPVDGLPQDMEEANQEVWGTVTHLLLPHLGKCYAKFYPARKAWGYRVPETFGVVLGKITPDRFLRLYFEACQAQAAAIRAALPPSARAKHCRPEAPGAAEPS